jgi:hypothetical protein
VLLIQNHSSGTALLPPQVPGLGIGSIGASLARHGYRQQEYLTFPSKKLLATWWAPGCRCRACSAVSALPGAWDLSLPQLPPPSPLPQGLLEHHAHRPTWCLATRPLRLRPCQVMAAGPELGVGRCCCRRCCCRFAPPQDLYEQLPRVFVSELQVEKLSPESQVRPPPLLLPAKGDRRARGTPGCRCPYLRRSRPAGSTLPPLTPRAVTGMTLSRPPGACMHARTRNPRHPIAGHHPQLHRPAAQRQRAAGLGLDVVGRAALGRPQLGALPAAASGERVRRLVGGRALTGLAPA